MLKALIDPDRHQVPGAAVMPFLASDLMKNVHWMPRDQGKPITWGHFFCPRCSNVRPYQLKAASVDFTFYFIPLFEMGDLDEFAVCLLCKKGFDPKVLEAENQSLFRLAWVARRELASSTPEVLKSKLLKTGLEEPFVDKLLVLAQN
jgi:hypothetical protein